MPITNIIAKVKKINLDNKVIGDDWKQSITIMLGDIELTDANLIALRKFRPNEEVLVNLKTVQLVMGELEAEQRTRMLEISTDATPSPEIKLVPPEENFIQLDQGNEEDIEEAEAIGVEMIDDDAVDDVDPASILKSFSFS